MMYERNEKMGLHCNCFLQRAAMLALQALY